MHFLEKLGGAWFLDGGSGGAWGFADLWCGWVGFVGFGQNLLCGRARFLLGIFDCINPWAWWVFVLQESFLLCWQWACRLRIGAFVDGETKG